MIYLVWHVTFNNDSFYVNLGASKNRLGAEQIAKEFLEGEDVDIVFEDEVEEETINLMYLNAIPFIFIEIFY